MPLPALSLNLGWEIVYALIVSEKFVERATFTVWLAIDCLLIYPGVLKYGREYEWNHAAPLVRRYLGLWLALMCAAAVAGQFAFASWWIANKVGAKEGKFYRGKDWGPDISELGFWSAAVSQIYLSAASLVMLAVRGHSGGVSWGVCYGLKVLAVSDSKNVGRLTRFLGTTIGLYAEYGWAWYFWRDAHEYVRNQPSMRFGVPFST